MPKKTQEPETPRPRPDPAKLQCEPQNAGKFKDWLANRGGIAVWLSADLGDPGASCFTPARTPEGGPYPKPHWKYQSKPERVVTDPAKVEVVFYRVWKELKLGVERGSGLQLNFTTGGSNRLRKELDRAGEGAKYVNIFPAFEGCPNCVVIVPEKLVPLTEFDHEAWEREQQEKERGAAANPPV